MTDPRTVGLLSLAAMTLCLLLTISFPSKALAYASLVLLTIATVCYLVPGRPPRHSLAFSRRHHYFRNIERLNLVSVPITFIFVYLGIWSQMRSILLLVFLALLRMLPSHLIRQRIHVLKRRLVESIPPSSIGELGPSPMVKVVGYVHETRTRYRLFDYRLMNSWVVDEAFEKVFITGLTEIRRIGQVIQEGWRACIVGPSATGPRIRAVKPVAAAVTPASWHQGCAEWFDLMWIRSWRRRWGLRALGSGAYLVVILTLTWVIRYVGASSSWVLPAIVLSAASSIFFGMFSHKSLVESSYYEVSNYFEPDVRRLTENAKKNRIDKVRREVQAGRAHVEYLVVLERAALGSR